MKKIKGIVIALAIITLIIFVYYSISSHVAKVNSSGTMLRKFRQEIWQHPGNE